MALHTPVPPEPTGAVPWHDLCRRVQALRTADVDCGIINDLQAWGRTCVQLTTEPQEPRGGTGSPPRCDTLKERKEQPASLHSIDEGHRDMFGEGAGGAPAAAARADTETNKRGQRSKVRPHHPRALAACSVHSSRRVVRCWCGVWLFVHVVWRCASLRSSSGAQPTEIADSFTGEEVTNAAMRIGDHPAEVETSGASSGAVYSCLAKDMHRGPFGRRYSRRGPVLANSLTPSQCKMLHGPDVGVVCSTASPKRSYSGPASGDCCGGRP